MALLVHRSPRVRGAKVEARLAKYDGIDNEQPRINYALIPAYLSRKNFNYPLSISIFSLKESGMIARL